MGDPRRKRRERHHLGRAQRLTEDERSPDSLAPQIASDRSPPRQTVGVAHAAFAGCIGGCIAGIVGGLPYFLTFRGEPLPWRQLASAFFAFVICAGAVYAAGARAGALLLDRWLGARGWTALAGSVLGGALVGPLPGGVGVAYWGSQPYAFMGTAMLALAPVAGAWVTSALIARADSLRAGVPSSRIRMLGVALASTALFGAMGAAVVFAIDDELLLEWLRAGARDPNGNISTWGLASVGVTVGTILGALVGGHLGVTLALARAARPRS